MTEIVRIILIIGVGILSLFGMFQLGIAHSRRMISRNVTEKEYYLLIKWIKHKSKNEQDVLSRIEDLVDAKKWRYSYYENDSGVGKLNIEYYNIRDLRREFVVTLDPINGIKTD